MKYKLVEGSQSGHCCFEFTVVDTTKPKMIGDEHYNNQFKAVCECFDFDDAYKICEALNA